MEFAKIYENLMKIEDEFDLFNLKIDGVYFWERIRFRLLRVILTKTGVSGQAHTKIESSIYTRTLNVAQSVKNLFYRNPFLASYSDIFFYGHPRRKLGKDHKWHDIYCDPVIEHLNYSYVYVEKSYSGKHYTPSATPNIRYLDLPLFLATLLRKLKLVKVELDEKEILLIKQLNKRFYLDFNLDINLLDIIKRSLLNRKSQLPIYKLLLRKIRPKLIVIICSYGNETFVEAGKMIGIPVVELQHGFISRSHLGYSFPGPKRNKHTFPDYLLTFGEMWDSIAEYPIEKKNVISVGYPYMENEVRKYRDLRQKDQLVFISQGTVGSELSKIAVELSEREKFTYKIIYKLHPGEYARWRKEYPWLIDSKIKVIDGEYYPLYKIFAESKVQVGVSSTAIFEGLAFGLKTILLPLGAGIDGMRSLIDNNMAVVVESIDEMCSVIDKMTVSSMEIDYIFKKNALTNMRNVIECLVENYAK